MPTWRAEMTVVAAVLATVTTATHGDWRAWVAACAVLMSFGHAQVADRLAEREAHRERPVVECYRKAARYFIAKEILWFAFFVSTGAWAALAGVVLFMAYPPWRSFYRRRHPIDA